ncbi:MAG: hypothetical protein GIX02_03935 [Candidatus Eremiobacteraeota bacterium]|nr:hypothetical protein [Candidatus Eremiobacteraeota bacterium]
MDVQLVLELLERFHITDRALLRARDAAREGDGHAVAQLKQRARGYFSSLEREAARQLKDIDRKLDDLYQRQYNLQAERGVAERRRAGAQHVLDAISSDERPRGDACAPQV